MTAGTSLVCNAGVSVAVGCGALCIVFRGPHRDSFAAEVVGWTDEAVAIVGVPAIPVVVLLEDAAEKPSAEARQAYARSLAACADKTEAHAQIILSQGLRGAAFRAIVSTIFLLARRPTRTKVFGDVGSAAQWVVDGSDVSTVDPEVLASFIESVRHA